MKHLTATAARIALRASRSGALAAAIVVAFGATRRWIWTNPEMDGLTALTFLGAAAFTVITITASLGFSLGLRPPREIEQLRAAGAARSRDVSLNALKWLAVGAVGVILALLVFEVVATRLGLGLGW